MGKVMYSILIQGIHPWYLVVQLLEKGCIVSGDDNKKLLEIMPPPVTQYIPENSKKIGKWKQKEGSINEAHFGNHSIVMERNQSASISLFQAGTKG